MDCFRTITGAVKYAFVEKSGECSICRELVSTYDLKILSCGHTLCRLCVKELANYGNNHKCYTCRQKVTKISDIQHEYTIDNEIILYIKSFIAYLRSKLYIAYSIFVPFVLVLLLCISVLRCIYCSLFIAIIYTIGKIIYNKNTSFNLAKVTVYNTEFFSFGKIQIQTENQVSQNVNPNRNVIILIDSSSSMSSKQYKVEDTVYKRLDIAKKLAEGIISNLPEGTIVSLIVFSSNVNIKYKNEQLTNNLRKNMISEIQKLKHKSGSNIRGAFDIALTCLQENRKNVIFCITDDETHEENTLPNKETLISIAQYNTDIVGCIVSPKTNSAVLTTLFNESGIQKCSINTTEASTLTLYFINENHTFQYFINIYGDSLNKKQIGERIDIIYCGIVVDQIFNIREGEYYPFGIFVDQKYPIILSKLLFKLYTNDGKYKYINNITTSEVNSDSKLIERAAIEKHIKSEIVKSASCRSTEILQKLLIYERYDWAWHYMRNIKNLIEEYAQTKEISTEAKNLVTTYRSMSIRTESIANTNAPTTNATNTNAPNMHIASTNATNTNAPNMHIASTNAPNMYIANTDAPNNDSDFRRGMGIIGDDRSNAYDGIGYRHMFNDNDNRSAGSRSNSVESVESVERSGIESVVCRRS